ncbi:MAG TPA: PorP/SprF family type IX secretion system membrane protein [Flavobacteriales bacterium]|nr:hypothetical protein [Flavobacteriales bacterium]HRE76163.1 PorP/SprF family type IX secretion system membrane protein [Flavobacteriales bacterium]HRE96422.1 PorP/SprF family type IX secretion system membrane protein [Flavobacteriales bacterium]HRJ35250.1 PorP/SprF family type IX secretion system membrane protein [Flavobacteriales bacterium]HRJ39884.1 PorP/SprF family type IX secretion system membrane protein [Flavobacteriales bacterium]
MQKVKIIFSAMLLGWSVQVFGQQDIHFSQFYTASAYINPATAGMFNGDIRGVMNYRSQWKSVSEPFTTFTGSVDARVANGSEGFLSIGGVFYNDKAGSAKLTSGQYGLNIAWAAKLKEGMYWTFGVQPSLLTKSINGADLYYGNQWIGTEFSSAVANNETFVNDKFMAFDVSAGSYWLYRPHKETAYYLGLAGAHLTRPNVSFLGTKDKMLMKFTFHGGAEFELSNSNMAILPNFLVKMQGVNRIINFGSDVKYIIQKQSHYTGYSNEISAGLGAYYRVGDAFWGALQFNWTGFTLAFSYDINLSNLSVATNGNGGMEMMLMYRAGIGAGKGKSTRLL